MVGPSEVPKFTQADPSELPSTDCKHAVVGLGHSLNTMVVARSHFQGSLLASYFEGRQGELADCFPYGHIHIR